MLTQEFKTSLVSGAQNERRPPLKYPSFADVLRQAQALLGMLAERGVEVRQSDRKVILDAAASPDAVDTATKDQVYAAYTLLAEQASELNRPHVGTRPFGKALLDAEQLVRYAAEVGRPVGAAVSAEIFGARTAFNDGKLTDDRRARFYEAYAAVANEFKDVTAETIHSASSKQVEKNLWYFTPSIIVLACLVATVSVFSFFFDDLSERIRIAVAEGDVLAVNLRTNLEVQWKDIDSQYISDPCAKMLMADEKAPPPKGTDQLQSLQKFATLIRDIQGSAIKLDGWLSKPFASELECDPYGKECNGQPQDDRNAQQHLQINPSVVNYPGEVLCKIFAYQKIRAFGMNIKNDYAGMYGAIAAYALPICYALLGAMAFQLRYFAELIRRKTYHFSFAEPARLVTAVIAGAICGLFNPARGLNLPPLATAFLVGYGVEVFFRFLDTLTNAFVPNFQASPSQAIATLTVAKAPPGSVATPHTASPVVAAGHSPLVPATS